MIIGENLDQKKDGAVYFLIVYLDCMYIAIWMSYNCDILKFFSKNFSYLWKWFFNYVDKLRTWFDM